MNPEAESKNRRILRARNAWSCLWKGSASFPQCDFSARAVAILNEVVWSFTTVDVLEDDDIRNGIKEYGNWPTIPQLYRQEIGRWQ